MKKSYQEKKGQIKVVQKKGFSKQKRHKHKQKKQKRE